MKKLSIILLILLVLILCSCQESFVSASQSPIQTDMQTASPSKPGNIGKAHVDWGYYETLEDLVKSSDQIIIADVIEKNGKKTVDYKELGITREEFETDVVPLVLRISEVLKGDLTPGSNITIYQTLMLYDEDQLINAGETRLFFLYGKPGQKEGQVYQYDLKAPMIGYPLIVNGALIVNEGNNLMKSGIKIEDAKAQIADAIKNISENEKNY